MKLLAVTLLVLVAVVSARNINLEDIIDLEDLTSYGYYRKIGIPLAQEIRIAEETADRNPSRIIGGYIASRRQFPYQVGLLADLPGRQGVCGGSLLNQRRVLTAAHCWFDGENQVRRFTVVLGSNCLYGRGTKLNTASVVMHGSWSPSLFRYDIAMINLPSNVATSNSIRPIALPSGNELNNLFVGATATASGFGNTRDGSGVSNKLRHVNMPVIANNVCSQTYAFIQSSHLCTSSANGRNTCKGDSGGPIVVNSNNRRILIGVTSFGSIRSCEDGAPAAFTRVTSFISWINQRL